MKRAVTGINNLPHGLHIDRPIGEAHSLGWRVVARCAYSRMDGLASNRSSRECIYRKELDMETLVWTRGRTFPLSRLESRLRCPTAVRGRLWSTQSASLLLADIGLPLRFRPF